MAAKEISVADKVTQDQIKATIDQVKTLSQEVDNLLKNTTYGLNALKAAINQIQTNTASAKIPRGLFDGYGSIKKAEVSISKGVITPILNINGKGRILSWDSSTSGMGFEFIIDGINIGKEIIEPSIAARSFHSICSYNRNSTDLRVMDLPPWFYFNNSVKINGYTTGSGTYKTYITYQLAT